MRENRKGGGGGGQSRGRSRLRLDGRGTTTTCGSLVCVLHFAPAYCPEEDEDMCWNCLMFDDAQAALGGRMMRAVGPENLATATHKEISAPLRRLCKMY